jgi:octanoyl-[GcvH]:protein N-octanoyltransferase
MKKHCVLLHQRGPLVELVHQDRLFAYSLSSNEIGLRFYETHGVIFGKLDQSLSRFEEGKAWIESMGYPTTVREQGGLGVIVDEGVINVSLILPSSLKPFSGLYEAYDTMVMLLQEGLKHLNKKVYFYEIENSYCPGKYDGVIDQKKFCGIAQKRIKDKVIVSATILVNQNQQHRGTLMKQFYEIANPNNDRKYPSINPQSMATLSDVVGRFISTQDIHKALFESTKRWVESL